MTNLTPHKSLHLTLVLKAEFGSEGPCNRVFPEGFLIEEHYCFGHLPFGIQGFYVFPLDKVDEILSLDFSSFMEIAIDPLTDQILKYQNGVWKPVDNISNLF